MVKKSPNDRKVLWTLLPCAIVLILAAWLRGAEYDEQYTLFLTAGVPRPAWPEAAFPAGLARDLQAGRTGLAAIGHDLRVTDVHPPLYFWLISLWREIFGGGLFAARLFSVACGLGALALTGVIARSALVPPAWAMAFTLGCYAFTYTSAVARGFALAQLLLLGGVACLLPGRRGRDFALAGLLLGAATLTNYLALFVALACLATVGVEAGRSLFREPAGGLTIRHATAAGLGFVAFIPADLWWFLAQRGSRAGQFPPFSPGSGFARLAGRMAGSVLGGLPLYAAGIASLLLAAGLGLVLLGCAARIAWRWRRIGTPRARRLFALAAAAPPAGLMVLGAIFDSTPIELRYLAFSCPFVALLLAGALGPRLAPLLLAVQAASIAGLMLAPRTMQPARAAAQAAAALVGDGVVLLPRGNDGVGVAGAFAIESPPALPLMLIPGDDTTGQIRARVAGQRRVVLVLLEQDDASRAAAAAMRHVFAGRDWREIARRSNVALYERIGDGE